MHICASGRTVGFGSRGLCAERAVGDDPFAVLLADDFLTDYEPGGGGSGASFCKQWQIAAFGDGVDGPDISKYGVVVQMGPVRVLQAWLKNLMQWKHPQTWPRSDVMF